MKSQEKSSTKTLANWLYLIGVGAYALWMIDMLTHGAVTDLARSHRRDVERLRRILLTPPKKAVPQVVTSAEELVRESWERAREHIRQHGELPDLGEE